MSWREAALRLPVVRCSRISIHSAHRASPSSKPLHSFSLSVALVYPYIPRTAPRPARSRFTASRCPLHSYIHTFRAPRRAQLEAASQLLAVRCTRISYIPRTATRPARSRFAPSRCPLHSYVHTFRASRLAQLEAASQLLAVRCTHILQHGYQLADASICSWHPCWSTLVAMRSLYHCAAFSANSVVTRSSYGTRSSSSSALSRISCSRSKLLSSKIRSLFHVS